MNTLYCKQLRLLYSTYIIHKLTKQLIGLNIYEMDVVNLNFVKIYCTFFLNLFYFITAFILMWASF